MLPSFKKGLYRCNQVSNLKMKSLSGITQWVLSPITCIFMRKFGNMCPCKSKSEGDLRQRRGRENVATDADADMWPQPRNACLNGSCRRMNSPLESLKRL